MDFSQELHPDSIVKQPRLRPSGFGAASPHEGNAPPARLSSGPGAACHSVFHSKCFHSKCFHSKCFHSKWGVERRETRRLARPPERSEDRPERLGAFPFPLRSGKDASRRSTCGDFRPRGRSSVAGRKDSLQRSLPDRRGFRPRASRPVQPLKADPRSGAGRLPRASREQGCKPCARAPHPDPPPKCPATAPSMDRTPEGL